MPRSPVVCPQTAMVPTWLNLSRKITYRIDEKSFPILWDFLRPARSFPQLRAAGLRLLGAYARRTH